MSPGAERIRFRPSLAYVAARTGALVVVFLLAAPFVGVGASGTASLVIFTLVAAGWVALMLFTDATTITDGTVRGASSTVGTWSTRPPKLEDVEAITTTTHGMGRAVMVESTSSSGLPMRWRLDAPRTLRWGNDRRFDADVDRLRHAWAETSRQRRSPSRAGSAAAKAD